MAKRNSKPKAQAKAKKTKKAKAQAEKPAEKKVEPKLKYSVSASPESEDDIKKMPKQEQQKVIKLITRMEDDPTAGAARLQHTAKGAWRKRLGDIRVIYRLDAAEKDVRILAVRWRKEDTYDDLDDLMST